MRNQVPYSHEQEICMPCFESMMFQHRYNMTTQFKLINRVAFQRGDKDLEGISLNFSMTHICNIGPHRIKKVILENKLKENQPILVLESLSLSECSISTLLKGGGLTVIFCNFYPTHNFVTSMQVFYPQHNSLIPHTQPVLSVKTKRVSSQFHRVFVLPLPGLDPGPLERG